MTFSIASPAVPVLLTVVLTVLLTGCETTHGEGGQTLAREEVYVPTGTLIPRKKDQGLGAAQVSTVRKDDLENQRNMNSGQPSPTGL